MKKGLFPMSRVVLIVVAMIGLGVGAAVSGESDSSRQGHGKGGHGRGGGPMPVAAKEAIHELFSQHEKIRRKVTLTNRGYRAVTTSSDAEVAATLQKHVSQMKERLAGGYGVRRWDPAFAEFRQHVSDMEMKIEMVEGGVSVEVVGKTEAAVRVARNHARIISGFVKKGPTAAHATHDPALEPSKSTNDHPTR